MGQMVTPKHMYLSLVDMTLFGKSIFVNITKDPEMLAKA